MQLRRYESKFNDSILALHRSAIEGFSLGMSQLQDEADLMAIELTYLDSGGEFLLGFVDDQLVAMGGFKRLSGTLAELKRMRIKRDCQGHGYGSAVLSALEQRALEVGILTLCLETAKRRPLTLEFYRKHGYLEEGAGFYGSVETVKFSKLIDRNIEMGQ